MKKEGLEEDGQYGRWRVIELSNVNGNVTKLKSVLNFLIRKSEIFSINGNGEKNFTKMKFIYPFSISILVE